MFPAFVARSRADPNQELRDPEAWSRMWLAARTRLAKNQPTAFNRWDPDSPACA
jgi:phytanoyl-CoA hydroxylase